MDIPEDFDRFLPGAASEYRRIEALLVKECSSVQTRFSFPAASFQFTNFVNLCKVSGGVNIVVLLGDSLFVIMFLGSN